MTSTPTLHKSFAQIGLRSIAVYYTREDGIDVKFIKDAHNGHEISLDQQDTDEVIRQIEVGNYEGT